MGEVERKCRARSISKKLPLFEHVLVGVIYEETAYSFIFVFFICFWQFSIIRFPKVKETNVNTFLASSSQ